MGHWGIEFVRPQVRNGGAMVDEEIYWQDVLDDIRSNRTANLKCPFCQNATLAVSKRERVTQIACQNKACRHFIEVGFGASAEDEMQVEAKPIQVGGK